MIRTASAFLFGLALLTGPAGAQEKKAEPGKVSFDKKIRPILQAHCLGCHQPAKAKGGYVMTSFDKLLAGGEAEGKAVVPGKPDQSSLLRMITPDAKGEAEMPKGKKALHREEIDLVKKWILEGAADDTPVNARARYDMDHPPVYTRPPVVTSLDFSPDGQLLAVAGFHEAILFKADGSARVARLVGLSERIQSVRFSPDGKFLAVTGGLPGRAGEVQIWEVEKKKLLLSVPVTFDTLYGASWSPDGTKIAFGCADNTVRAIDAKTGEQVLYQGAHNDWVQDTVFSADGSHLISVGRDRAAKLIEVATQRFVDNITSITPGALKGGLTAVARHPQRDEVVLGGADGAVKIFRMHRLTKRVIGDNANLIRELPSVKSVITSVAVSRDGKRIASGSSLDGKGGVHVYSYDFDGAVPDTIKAIMAKVITSRKPEEQTALDKFHTQGVKLVSSAALPQAGVYAVAIHPRGQAVAAAGQDGIIRLIETETGNVAGEFAAAQVDARAAAVASTASLVHRPAPVVGDEVLPAGARLAALEVSPPTVNLSDRFDYVQLVVTGRLESGETVDVTRMVEGKLAADIVLLQRSGMVQPKSDGKSTLTFSLGGKSVEVPVTVAGVAADFRADFIRDVNPIMSRVGCNAGTCHGSAQGKNGFKLSLRGYDAEADVRALTDEHASRRVNLASPEDSLMLLKPTGAVPHEGGQVFTPGEPYYEVLRAWIAQGATLNFKVSRVARIELFPVNPVVQRIGARQQIRVVATYADGRVRDVTRDASIESSLTEIALPDRSGVMTAVRRGEAAVLARFEGAYTATTLTVMGDRTGFTWEPPPAWNRVDELVADKWQRMKIRPSDLAGDAEFLRRVHLDLTGLPPKSEEVRAFLADARETRVKRDEVVDKLIGSEDYIEHWTNKWADLLQVNRKFLGAEGASSFRKWIRNEIAKNTPYDEFARKIIGATGSNRENPPASYYKILRDPETIAENTTHLFLAVRFNCTKCHDHPFERWTQNQYYETSAFFARVKLDRDPASAGTIGGTAVEGAKPTYEIISDRKDGEVTHLRTGQPAPAKFPYDCKFEAPPEAGRRQQLAAWITSPDNAYFAKSYVNRLWGYHFGTGIIEPIDDIRAGNPASNPQLLDYLTQEFLKSGFNPRHVVKLICSSRTYQLSVVANPWNADDRINYSHATARRLPAEVLYDAVQRVAGSTSKFPGIPAGTRAAALPDSGIELPGGFLATFGRPVRESACECERNSDLRLGAVMALISGPTIADAIADGENEIAKLVAKEAEDPKLIDEIFMRVLNRPAKPAEVQAVLRSLAEVDRDHAKLSELHKGREEWWGPVLARLSKEREEAIASTKAGLAAYEASIAPRVAAEKVAQQDRVAKAEAALKAYEETIPAKILDWEKRQAKDPVDWTPLVATKLEATNGARLVPQPDLSITAFGKNAKGNYVITAPTDLKGITALRLEVLPDPKFPAQGPGRAPDGNFVLTQFEVQAAPKSDPAKLAKIALQNAKADFSQKDFDVKNAANGAPNNGTGWALSPFLGVTHWATFEAKEPVGHEGGTILTITLRQTFNADNYMIGRFRLSVTTKPSPGLSLPDELRAILLLDPAQRDSSQKEALTKHFRGIDAELQQKNAAVAEAKKPLPIDPGVKERQDRLAEVTKPVPADPKLLQLRQDAEASGKQIQNKRLTMAQDLAWALINSPSFLFNR